MTPEDFFKKASLIKLAVFDVDGVMTSGDLIFGGKGEEYKVFNVQDGLGLVMLREAGIKVAVISARSSSIVANRMTELGVEHIIQDRRDKEQALKLLISDLGLKKEQTVFTGDDILDLPAMSAAGISIAVANAHQRVKAGADWITKMPGGRGAVREICEILLQAQGRLDEIYQKCMAT
jgi:3-deoxy-D-manno-octulosonate 8-phosphate phosphatase (KDO 8-P phosphatase)